MFEIKIEILDMKKLILLATIAFTCYNVNAQMGINKKSARDVETLKERPLLVVLMDEDEQHGKMKNYNENIQKAINDIWTFSPSIRFITKEEWKTIYKDKDEAKKYAHLYYTEKMLQANAPNNCLLIGLAEKKVVTHFVFTPDLGLADLMLSVTNLQKDLEIGNNYKKIVKEQVKLSSKFLKDSLEHKILYIDEGFVSKKLLKGIHDIYDYQYEIVSKEEIDDAIVAKDPKILFIRHFIKAQRPTTQNGTTESMHFALKLVYNASNLEVISGTGAGAEIDIKDIEMFIRLINY